MTAIPAEFTVNAKTNPMKRQSVSGFTLVELLVALAISTVIAIAAMSALFVSRQGFTMADAASQLRDNTRFSTDLIQRLAVQSGYKDLAYAATNRSASESTNPVPNISGFNNAIPSSTDPENSFTARSAGLGFGSDVLILRYQPSETFPGSGVSDQSMIDCNGISSTAIPMGRDDRIVSVLSVAVSNNEPTLMCTTQNAASGVWFSRPLIAGVENFQVLYGIKSNSASLGAVADTYVRADQLTVAMSRTIRSLRIGMVIRGPIGSAADATAQTYYPLGMAKESSAGTPGHAMSTPDSASSADKGTRFSPTPDNRLRQVQTFTVHLRNSQGL